MRHIMIDLERMGTRFDAPILSIGATYFDPDNGALGERFYEAIDIDDAFRFGKVSGSTVKWWMQQSDAARQAAICGTATLAAALHRFIGFCGNGDAVVWGNGATFDITILEYAFARIERQVPWKFWNVRDCRTIADLGSHLGISTKGVIGTAHHALDDAVHQAKWVSAMWMLLKGAPAPVADEDLVG